MPWTPSGWAGCCNPQDAQKGRGSWKPAVGVSSGCSAGQCRIVRVSLTDQCEPAALTEWPEVCQAREHDERSAAEVRLIERRAQQRRGETIPPAGRTDDDGIDLPVDRTIHQEECISEAVFIAAEGHETHRRPEGEELAAGAELRGSEFPECVARGLVGKELRHGEELDRVRDRPQSGGLVEVVQLRLS